MWLILQIIVIMASLIAGAASTFVLDRYPVFFRSTGDISWTYFFALALLCMLLVGPVVMAFEYKRRLQKRLIKPLTSPLWQSNFIWGMNPLPSFHIGGFVEICIGLPRVIILYYQGQTGCDVGHLLLITGVSILGFVYFSQWITRHETD